MTKTLRETHEMLSMAYASDIGTFLKVYFQVMFTNPFYLLSWVLPRVAFGLLIYFAIFKVGQLFFNLLLAQLMTMK